jgi:hypothetical protein
LFYRAGHTKRAGEIYLQLRRDYSVGEHSSDYSMPMIEFVRARITEELDRISEKDAAEQIMMSLHEAYFQYSVRRDKEAEAPEKWAREIYDVFQKKTGLREDYRMGLPDFEMLRYIAFIRFLNDQEYPVLLRRNLLGRIQVERPELFEQLQKQEKVYEDLLQQKSQPVESAPK